MVLAHKIKNGTSKKNGIILFVVWWMAWANLHLWILQHFGSTYYPALVDAALSYLLLAAFCLFVINNMKYYLPKKEKYLYVIFMSFALSALWLAITNILLRRIFSNETVYLELLRQSLVLRYAVAFLMIACNTLLSLLWYTQKEEKEELERRSDTEKLARQAELNKLRQQMQPHFLFNSLNSISALTARQPEQARHMIQQLSDFLRGTLRNDTLQWITLKEELNYVELYLDIEKVRFGYRLQSRLQCDDTALSLTLPSMLLQPLVENAIKFGLYDTIGEVEILITATVKKGMLEIMVQNPYDETTAMPLKGTGFGLESIRRRLFLLYGRNDLLIINKASEKFIVELSIPQNV
jgi:two-component system LytT family sensor kinase